jgi:branched-chain amino acid transport system ATP-binding protein
MTVLLEIKNLWKDFGGFVATRDVSFDLEEGERHAIIGPNGAGKTTFFNLITGHMAPSKGTVKFRGRDITGMPPHKVVKLGLARSFQRINIFPRMTLFENVQVALMSREGQSTNMFKLCFDLHVEETYELLETVHLREAAHETAGELAYGKQKQLELAIALAEKPDVLLLDEPTAGMSPSETNEAIRLIDRITKERGLTLLFTEHDMGVVFGISDRISVLHHGEIIARGLPDEVRNDPDVRRIYLGEAADDAA